MDLPNMKTPCLDRPFRKDTSKRWLGSTRMAEILEADLFVRHKKIDMQCNNLGNPTLRKPAYQPAFFRPLSVSHQFQKSPH